VQVHGGMGYIEETGAAQFHRDARIAPIYEGTNGIQAMDLIGRKLLRDDGKAMRALLAEMAADAKAGIESGAKTLARATDAVLAGGKQDASQALAVATPFLALCGTVIAGWLLARSAAKANGADPAFSQAKRATAAFYAANILPESEADAALVTGGAASTLGFPMDAF
jgi:acyl-CoA dehydrogenase